MTIELTQYRDLLNRPCTTWTLEELDWLHRHGQAITTDRTRSGAARAMAATCILIVRDEMYRRAALIDSDWLAQELDLETMGICLS